VRRWSPRAAIEQAKDYLVGRALALTPAHHVAAELMLRIGQLTPDAAGTADPRAQT
jgi:hypothetical protein